MRKYSASLLTVMVFRTAHTIYAAALKTTTHPKTRYRKPYAATQHLMLLMMGVCTRNMSSYINKITLLHQVGISNYLMRQMHGQTTLNNFVVFRLTSALYIELQMLRADE